MTTLNKFFQSSETLHQLNAIFDELNAFEVNGGDQTEPVHFEDSTSHAAIIKGVLKSVQTKFSTDPRGGYLNSTGDYSVDKKKFNDTPIDAMTFICSDPRRAVFAKLAIAWAAMGTVTKTYHPFYSESTLHSSAQERMLWPHAIIGSVRTSEKIGQLLLAPILPSPNNRQLGNKDFAWPDLLLTDVQFDSQSPVTLASDSWALSVIAPSQRAGMAVSPSTSGSLTLHFPENSVKDTRKFTRRASEVSIAKSRLIAEIPAADIDSETFIRFNIFNHLGVLAIGFNQTQQFDEIVKSFSSETMESPTADQSN